MLALLVSYSAMAESTTTHYWGMGKMVKPDKSHGSAFVVGKRTVNKTDKVTTDTQYYVSQTLPSEEYTYVFHHATKKMDVLSGKNKVGEGSFECKGAEWSWTECSYKYEVSGKDGYKSEGKDLFGHPGQVYTEHSEMHYPGKPNPELWDGEYLPLTEKMYDSFRTKF